MFASFPVRAIGAGVTMAPTVDLRQAIDVVELASAITTEDALRGTLWPAVSALIGPAGIRWVAEGMTGSTNGVRRKRPRDMVVLADLATPCRVEFTRDAAEFGEEEFGVLQLLRPHLLAALHRVERRAAAVPLSGGRAVRCRPAWRSPVHWWQRERVH